ncbi:ISNCY family transposase [Lacticaseibacillus casei]|uniref:ISNCY family transposase n=1 Tax=Lacticaseibacillus TaxID=2759736 RepID=UPI001BCF2747|nr:MULTISPECIES: ISNCY family transposase [Lacticaseibacillus]QVI38055.1 ISNCY family transposase [Lacticaseibacillus casei]QVI38061.1 ISNCY family transposase [Lacticaseibacillus casei]WFB43076.1 ISNCY family transposase [Lacticaseibacillus huelsenbergensis]WFB43082.1 ISNCY family transposase [Lacticaseibacillus huelsenbergensis]
MKKVVLTMKEEERYRVIKAVVNGKTPVQRAAVKLKRSERTIYRLIKLYKQQGKDGFIHGNAGREPANKRNAQLERQIIRLYTNKYAGFNIAHFHEFLTTAEQIAISESSLRLLFRRHHILSPKAHKATKRRIKRELKEKEKKSKLLSKRDEATLSAIEVVENIKAHPERPRKHYSGEQVQMDASWEYWFGTQKTTLHAAIDDQSGNVVGGYFAKQETLSGYYHVFAQVLRDYGAPAEFLTDRRTVFNSNKKEGSPSTENPLTRFGYACQTLGTELSVTSIPQAKGRIERLLETFQDRLTSELRLHNITTIADANRFLVGFIKRYNDRFASTIKSSMSVFDKQLTPKEIDNILIIANERSIGHGHCVRFDNKRYLPHRNGELVYLPPHTKVLVIKSFTGRLYMTTDDDQVYDLFCVPKEQFMSAKFDLAPAVAPTPKRTRKIPAITHPWRRANYRDYLDSLGINRARVKQLVAERYPYKNSQAIQV